MAKEYKKHETPGIQVPVIYTKLRASIDFSQCFHLPEKNGAWFTRTTQIQTQIQAQTQATFTRRPQTQGTQDTQDKTRQGNLY